MAGRECTIHRLMCYTYVNESSNYFLFMILFHNVDFSFSDLKTNLIKQQNVNKMYFTPVDCIMSLLAIAVTC